MHPIRRLQAIIQVANAVACAYVGIWVRDWVFNRRE